MLKKPALRSLLGAVLLTVVGCAPTATTTRSASSAVEKRERAGAEQPASSVSALDDPNAVPISSAIRKVTVYSDRALVARQGAVKLTTTPTVYAFRQLPGWVDEGSVR